LVLFVRREHFDGLVGRFAQHERGRELLLHPFPDAQDARTWNKGGVMMGNTDRVQQRQLVRDHLRYLLARVRRGELELLLDET
jgi:hypothetical protein